MSDLLSPDTRCQLYSETNIDGSRWRLMRVWTKGLHEDGIEVKREIMGPSDEYKSEGFMIPSAGNDPSEWNTVGECMEIAADIHAEGGFAQRRKIPRATGKEWAEELVNQNDFIRQWATARSVFGPTGSTQRSRDWIRK